MDGIERINNEISGRTDDGEYYKWSTSLSYGRTFSTNITYMDTYFDPLSKDGEYSSRYMTPGDIIRVVVLVSIFVAIIVLIIIAAYKSHDPYMSERGFVPYHRSLFYMHGLSYYGRTVNSRGEVIKEPRSNNPSSRSGSSGGGSCACACACACAGGGRAGCSKKDFYKTNLKSKYIINEEKEENNKK